MSDEYTVGDHLMIKHEYGIRNFKQSFPYDLYKCKYCQFITPSKIVYHSNPPNCISPNEKNY